MFDYIALLEIKSRRRYTNGDYSIDHHKSIFEYNIR